MKKEKYNLLQENEADGAKVRCPDLSKDFADNGKVHVELQHLILPLCVLGLVGFLLWFGLKHFGESGKLIINEVVTNNRTAYTDETLGSPDYVELYNGSSKTVKLKDYGVSNSMKNCYRYTLPDTELAPGEYLLVYFTGGTPQSEDNLYCTGFGLDKTGDTVVLVDNNYGLLDSVEVPALPSDVSYGRDEEGDWKFFFTPTPGSANTGKRLDTLDTEGQLSSCTGLIFTEIVTNNHGCYKDEQKNSPDYIELYNGSGQPLAIGGCGIGTGSDRRYDYILPDITLEAGEYLLLVCSADENVTATYKTGFNLSKNGETLYLTDANYILLDTVSVPYLAENISWARRTDLSWGYGLTPTPGAYNSGEIAEEYDIAADY